jgi:hypothetical protein
MKGSAAVGHVLLMIGVLCALFFGWIAFAGFSEAGHQCPDGNDCEDATFAWQFGGALTLTALIVATVGVWLAFSKSTRR